MVPMYIRGEFRGQAVGTLHGQQTRNNYSSVWVISRETLKFPAGSQLLQYTIHQK